MTGIRNRLTRKISDEKLVDLFRTRFPGQKFWGIALSLYQSPSKRLVVVRTSNESILALLNAVKALEKHERFSNFMVSDSGQCGLQVDLILDEPRLFDIGKASDSSLEPLERFEVGVDGLRMKLAASVQYFLPGDGFVKSILGIPQLKRFITKMFPEAKELDSIEVKRFRSRSYLDYVQGTTFLYRGYPTEEQLIDPHAQSKIHLTQFSDLKNSNTSIHSDPSISRVPFIPPSPSSLLNAADASIRWLISHQRHDGSFLYYYDAASGNSRDHEHPKRDPIKDPYYNLLRHCGAVVTLILYYRLSKLAKKSASNKSTMGETLASLCGHEFLESAKVAEVAKNGCKWFCQQLVEYKLKSGETAAYPYYNRKAKLGGAGLGLFMLSLFAREIEASFDEPRLKIQRHLLDSVLPSGEFKYYHVYLDKLVSWDENQKYFSFYYPGEAIIGLAGHQSMENEIPHRVRETIRSTLRFLLHERPTIHQQHYQSLPSDSWLMMAVNELVDQKGFDDEDYRAFVFNDAEKMIQHQYHEVDALFPDYVGSFYYRYGDHPYPDGARAEGLLAAYDLAIKDNDAQRIANFRRGIERVAWATLRLYNSANAVYSAKNPSESFGGIRFKFTRQWFRIDTIQHVASFYLKLLYIQAQCELASTQAAKVT